MSMGLKQLAGPGVWGTTWEKRHPCFRHGYAIHTPPRGWHPPRPYIASRQYQQYWPQIIHKKEKKNKKIQQAYNNTKTNIKLYQKTTTNNKAGHTTKPTPNHNNNNEMQQ